MFKKLLLVGVVAAVTVVGLKAVGLFGHVKQEVVSWADDQVPVEKKIVLMRKDVNSLDRDIERVAHELAKEIVEVRHLTEKTTELRAALETEHKGLVARGDELKDATERVKVGGRFVSVPEAKERLKKDVDLHVRKKQSLESLEKALVSREKIRDTLKGQLDAMTKQKEELKAQIDDIEAQYKALQLQQIESKYQTDDTRLAKIKQSLADMRKKLEVEKTKLELTQKVREEKVADPAETVDEILAPLNQAKIAETK